VNFAEFIMDQILTAIEPLRQFSKDSLRLVKRCTKPDRYNTICYSVGDPDPHDFEPPGSVFIIQR
jgi:hypothetical protein